MKTIIFFVATLILGVLYFTLDRQLFYYGKNDINIYGTLPLKVRPVFKYDFEGGFALEDEHGFRLISRGDCQYVHSDIKLNVRNIIGYGYAEDILIAHIENADGRKYFIECTKNNNPTSKQDMIIKVLDEGVRINLKELKWIEIEKNTKYIRKVELLRNYTMFILITLFLVLFYLMVKRAKRLAKT